MSACSELAGRFARLALRCGWDATNFEPPPPRSRRASPYRPWLGTTSEERANPRSLSGSRRAAPERAGVSPSGRAPRWAWRRRWHQRTLRVRVDCQRTVGKETGVVQAAATGTGGGAATLARPEICHPGISPCRAQSPSGNCSVAVVGSSDGSLLARAPTSAPISACTRPRGGGAQGRAAVAAPRAAPLRRPLLRVAPPNSISTGNRRLHRTRSADERAHLLGERAGRIERLRSTRRLNILAHLVFALWYCLGHFARERARITLFEGGLTSGCATTVAAPASRSPASASPGRLCLTNSRRPQ